MMSSVRYVVPCLRGRSPNPRPAEIAVPSHRGFFLFLTRLLTHTHTLSGEACARAVFPSPRAESTRRVCCHRSGARTTPRPLAPSPRR